MKEVVGSAGDSAGTGFQCPCSLECLESGVCLSLAEELSHSIEEFDAAGTAGKKYRYKMTGPIVDKLLEGDEVADRKTGLLYPIVKEDSWTCVIVDSPIEPPPVPEWVERMRSGKGMWKPACEPIATDE